MRIGIIGPVYPDSFADNIVSVLATMGHDPKKLGAAFPLTSSVLVTSAWMLLSRVITIADAYQQRLVDRAKRNQLDVVLSVNGTLTPSTVTSLKRIGCTVALWFPDSVSNLDRQLMLISPYDAIFFKDRLLVSRLSSLTLAPVYYLPEACNPNWHRPPAQRDFRPVIVMAGTLFPARALLLNRLYCAGVPLEIYSTGYPRWLRGLPVQEQPLLPLIYRQHKARAFRNAAAVLNNLLPGEMDSVNCRLFEAAGCGAAVLCEDRPVLEELFEPGKEVLPFRTFDELMDRIQSCLTDPGGGMRIGDAAARRAHADHTYENRLGQMLSLLGTLQ